MMGLKEFAQKKKEIESHITEVLQNFIDGLDINVEITSIKIFSPLKTGISKNGGPSRVTLDISI
jgi:hypothetical protein